MPANVASDDLGFEVRTLKQCPPFVDAMTHGFLIPLACDVRVAGGRFEWHWEAPASSLGRYSRAPVSFHVPEQASGSPLFAPDAVIVKFNNFWTVELPEGWSLLVGHPFNREELPFRTLAGLVDADRYRDAFIQFPARWLEADFDGVMARGTPVAQCVPIRREAIELELGVLEGQAAERFVETTEAIDSAPGVYRQRYRATKP